MMEHYRMASPTAWQAKKRVPTAFADPAPANGWRIRQEPPWITLSAGRGGLFSRGGGAAQAGVDRPAETMLGDRHHRDPGEGGPVEPAQHREEIGRRLRQIARTAEPRHLCETGWRI